MPLLPFVSPDTSLKHHRFAAGDVVLFFAGRPKIAGARGAKNNATITDALFPSAKDAGRLPDEGERPGESKRRYDEQLRVGCVRVLLLLRWMMHRGENKNGKRHAHTDGG